jgi:phosphatidylglycerol:prolipoprotein diacylglycerol transferase
VEIFRGDLARGSVGAFSTSQFISLFLLAAGIVLFAVRGKEKHTLEEEE